MRFSASTGCLPLFLGLLFPFAAPAQADEYAVETEQTAWLRALIDLRVARGPTVPSWTDSGPGKTRFGGRTTESGFERVTRYEIAELAIEAGAALPGGLRGQLQLNVQHDVAGDYNPWIVEAFLRKEWAGESSGTGLQAGVMTIPFSLERTGPAWTPEHTISSSALNTWLWEDIKLTICR